MSWRCHYHHELVVHHVKRCCRVTLVEYYTKYLSKAAALLAAQAPVSAMRLFDREHQNIHEIVRWASQGPPEEALPFYSDILWESMPLLSGRMDLLQREVFCKARIPPGSCYGSSCLLQAECIAFTKLLSYDQSLLPCVPEWHVAHKQPDFDQCFACHYDQL